MEKEDCTYQKTEVSPNNNANYKYSKVSSSQKNDLELKRLNSHEVYLSTQKKKQNNTNSTKGYKKIYLNISKENQDKIKPKSKKSFNTNSNAKEAKTIINKNIIITTENNIFNNAKTKLSIKKLSSIT